MRLIFIPYHQLKHVFWDPQKNRLIEKVLFSTKKYDLVEEKIFNRKIYFQIHTFVWRCALN